MDLSSYRTLGRSGLAVSPFSLGTMTFGASRWGSDDANSRAVFDAYVEAGGNFVDTADVYSGGRSEEMLGGFIAERGLRDRMVVATKAGFAAERGFPHAGGNGAKHLHAALEGSLRRLKTDHVDLWWIHVWDTVTPAEEVLQTLSALVRAERIRHYGFSNAPAWWVAKIATLAQAHALPGPVALQYQYSLLDRTVEHEHLPAAREFGLGMQPWSPLGGGLLTGKYDRAEVERAPANQPGLPDSAAGKGDAAGDRLAGANPFGDMLFTDRNWGIVEALKRTAAEVGAPPATVALAWLLRRPGVSSVLLGASRAEQLHANLAALSLELTPAHTAALDKASAPETPGLYSIFSPAVNRMVFGGCEVAGWG